MKTKLYIAVAWVLGICCAFLSVVVLCVAPLGTALSVVVLSAALMTGLVTAIRREASRPATPAAPVVELSGLTLHRGHGVQLLETLHLLATTADIRTLESRIAFVQGLYERFLVGCRFDNYRRFVAGEFARYGELYRGRTPSDEQQELLLRPDAAALQAFVGRAIGEGYARCVEREAEHIRSLVRPSARQKRLDGLAARRDAFIALYDRFAIPREGHVDRIRALPIDHRLLADSSLRRSVPADSTTSA